MLRAIVLLILLANVFFFAWARGWLGAPPRHGEREPARLQAQVRPEAVSVLNPSTAGAAVQAARAAASVCLEAGPFADGDVSAAEATLLAAQLPVSSWSRIEAAAAPQWWVFAGRYPDAELRNRREEDLRKLGLAFELVSAPPELAPGLVLSRQSSKEAADAWLKDAPGGLRGARVVQPQAPSKAWRLRVPSAEPELADRLKALNGDALAGGFKPCAAAKG